MNHEEKRQIMKLKAEQADVLAKKMRATIPASDVEELAMFGLRMIVRDSTAGEQFVLGDDVVEARAWRHLTQYLERQRKQHEPKAS